MKALLGFALLISSVSAFAESTTITCHSFNTRQPLATISSEKKFKPAISFGFFEVVRSASGTMTWHESGETVPVNLFTGEGTVLTIRIKERTGLIVNASGAGYILDHGQHKGDIYCDGYESKKWPTQAAE